MKREDLLQEMKDSIGTQDPVVYFSKMVDAMSLLFNHIDRLENKIDRVKRQSALSIQWEPKVASDLLAKQVDVLRQDKDTYFAEITALKKAFAEDNVTQCYAAFCQFWEDTLGWHPFLD
jgi:hypothetical protein